MTRRILYVRPPGTGWEPITLLARLAGRLLDATVDEVIQSHYGRREHYALHWPRQRRGDELLVIAAHPGHLQEVTKRAGWWLRGHSVAAAWVIDSFWDRRIPGVALRAGHFDQLFITDAELTDLYEERTGAPTRFVPVGTDAMERGDAGSRRPVDVQRIGREPEEWSDDAVVGAHADSLGLTYGPSPAFLASEEASQRAVHRAMREAKFTVAFTNRVNAMGYTHPDREYITPRWFDAMANGAVVAGMTPDCEAARTLLWPEATLELGSVHRAEGLLMLRHAVDGWTPAVAHRQHLMALRRLDWRWRISEVADTLGWQTNALADEIRRLKGRISDVDAAGA